MPDGLIDFSRLTITDEDVACVEKELGKPFTEQQERVLRSLESKDVQACPGAGKTLVLAAKLSVLARKLEGTPYGVAVLSHTNAAMAEIIGRSRSVHTDVLLRYPHFVGTIQSFVDRYLAIPALIEWAQRRPASIGDEAFGHDVRLRLRELSWGTQTHLRRKYSKLVPEVVVSGLRMASIEPFTMELVLPSGNGTLPSAESPTYRDLAEFKESLARSGSLAYRDAYALADWYLSKHPELPEVFGRRFPFAFVDEAQDCQPYQLSLLRKVFRCSTVVQCFGDGNQSIFEPGSEGDPWRPGPDALTILESRRFGKRIAELCNSVALLPNHKMQGNPRVTDHPSFVLAFEHSSIENVLPTFGDLVIEVLGSVPPGKCKAVGAVAKAKAPEQEGYSIPSYWPSFRKAQISKARPYMGNYLAEAERVIRQERDVGEAGRILESGFLRALRIQFFGENQDWLSSRQSLRIFLQANHVDCLARLGKELFTMCDRLASPACEEVPVLDSFTRVFFPLFQGRLNEHAAQFLAGPAESGVPQQGDGSQVYHHRARLDIVVDTIHSVKGQTVTALLLLETFNKRYDLKELVPFLGGLRPRKSPNKTTSRFMRLAYVAMTRPTHLLCLAMDKDHLTGYRAALESQGWTIREVS